MKKALSMILALAMVFALCACSSQQPASTTAAATTAAPKADDTQTEAPAEESSEGKVFNIYAWNEEFKASLRNTTPFPKVSPSTGSLPPVTTAHTRKSWTRLC